MNYLSCTYCGMDITFRDKVPFNPDNSQHRCLRPLKQYACFKCKAPIKFLHRKPINADGQPHRCEPAPPKPELDIDPETGEIYNYQPRLL